MLDNLHAHKVTGIREAIADSHAQVLYPPPHYPDMNPVESNRPGRPALLGR